jgi:hypothetical protein
MLRSLRDLESYKVSATDGDVGSVVNFFIDDERWVVRYLIVSTGSLFQRSHVLISPIFFRDIEWPNRRFHLSLTADKIKDSPNIDVHKPVSRQHEQEYHGYFGFPYYWGAAGLWGMEAYPSLMTAGLWVSQPIADPKEKGDVHLRSVNEVRGYHIQGSDDSIGHVDDFIVDDCTWEVRYLVIDTGNLWSGKKVLVAPEWAVEVNWKERKVHVGLSREAIKNSPEWNPKATINSDYEDNLHKHYGREIYRDDGKRRVRMPSQDSKHHNE